MSRFVLHTFDAGPSIRTDPHVEPVPVERLRAYVAIQHAAPYSDQFRADAGLSFRDSREHARRLLKRHDASAVVPGVQTAYKMPKRAKVDRGRVFPEQSASVGQMESSVRAVLCHGVFQDHDIVNCHPTLLADACSAHDMDVPTLDDYVTGREERLAAIKDAYGVDRATAKRLPLILMYGGSLKTWLAKAGVQAPEPSPAVAAVDGFVTGLCRDVETIAKRVKADNQKHWKAVQADVSRHNRKVKETGEGRVKDAKCVLLSHFAQNLERQALEAVYAALTPPQRTRFVYTFDGFMLPVSHAVTPAFCEEQTQALFPSARWELKPFEPEPALKKRVDEAVERMRKQDEPYDVPPPSERQAVNFDIEYFRMCKRYRDKKAYWERFVCQIRLGDYVFHESVPQQDHLDKHSTEVIWVRKMFYMSEKKLSERFGDFATGLVAEKNGERDAETGGVILGPAGSRVTRGDGQKQLVFPGHDKFVKHWVTDEYKLSYKHLRFFPECKPHSRLEHTKDYFNTFKGYPEMLFEEVEPSLLARRGVETWRDILRHMVGGDLAPAEMEDTLVGVECMFAHSIFNPAQKLMNGLIIQSDQGTGKGLTMSTMRSLVGSEHFISSSKLSDFFGEHAEGMVNKLFCVLNEISFSDTKGLEDKLKALCTEETWQVNPKYVQPYEVDVYATIIMTTNNKFSVSINLAEGDRRWIVVSSTNEYAGKNMSAQRWGILASLYKTPDFLRALFHHLRDVYRRHPRYDFQAFKARNSRRKAYRDLASHSVPDTVYFFQDFIETKHFAACGTVVPAADADADAADDASVHSEDYVCALPPSGKEAFDELPEFSQTLRFNGKALTASFRKWAEDNHYSFGAVRNEKQMYMRLQSLNIPHDKVTRGGKVFLEMNMKDLYRHFHRKKFIEVDEKACPWILTKHADHDAGDKFAELWSLYDAEQAK